MPVERFPEYISIFTLPEIRASDDPTVPTYRPWRLDARGVQWFRRVDQDVEETEDVEDCEEEGYSDE